MSSCSFVALFIHRIQQHPPKSSFSELGWLWWQFLSWSGENHGNAPHHKLLDGSIQDSFFSIDFFVYRTFCFPPTVTVSLVKTSTPFFLSSCLTFPFLSSGLAKTYQGCYQNQRKRQKKPQPLFFHFTHYDLHLLKFYYFSLSSTKELSGPHHFRKNKLRFIGIGEIYIELVYHKY